MKNNSYITSPTQEISVDGTKFTYRKTGIHEGVPIILLNHLTGTLDNWDPRVVDGLAAHHTVITFNSRGVGSSEGKVPLTVEAMASDAVSFIKALGYEKVNILGFSLGGMVAQYVVQQSPVLVNKLILAGTGPAGGVGIENVTKLTLLDMLRAFLTFNDVKVFLFFTRTNNGKSSAKQFLGRLKERKQNRDTAISLSAFKRQLKAINRYGKQKPVDLRYITQSTLVANGDDDRMVPTSNTEDLAKRIKNSQLVIYPDAGHAGIFQYYEEFIKTALDFLKK
ncbi:MAG: alpha/beta hydrolase [Candidatus Microsaccharimonas sp.]